MNKIYDMRKKIVIDVFNWYLNGERDLNPVFDHDMYKFMKYHKLDCIYLAYCNVVHKNQLSEEVNCNYYKIMRENENQMKVANDIGVLLNDVRHVFLKGLPLLINNYKGVCHRYFNDIDILIERSDLSLVEKILFDSGYQYGWEYEGKMYSANRKDVLFQKMNTHETFMLVKRNNNGFISYVDVNFLFSWKGFDDDEYNRNIFDELYESKKTVIKDGYSVNCMDSNYMFLHLCCHLYNSMYFFALDRFYNGKDPEEIKLIQLMDILLVYREGVQNLKVAQLAQEMKHNEKVLFVLQLFKEVLDFSFDDLFNLISSDVDKSVNVERYYLPNGKEERWNIDINTRIYGVEEKKILFNEVF